MWSCKMWCEVSLVFHENNCFSLLELHTLFGNVILWYNYFLIGIRIRGCAIWFSAFELFLMLFVIVINKLLWEEKYFKLLIIKLRKIIMIRLWGEDEVSITVLLTHASLSFLKITFIIFFVSFSPSVSSFFLPFIFENSSSTSSSSSCLSLSSFSSHAYIISPFTFVSQADDMIFMFLYLSHSLFLVK